MSMARIRPMPLAMWASLSGNQPARDWFRSLPYQDRKKLGHDLRKLQYGWPVGMPLVRPLGGRLWELITNLPPSRESRVIFSTDGETLLVLHGFIKKAAQTPKHELDLARKRLKET